jgi:O-antigen ligase
MIRIKMLKIKAIFSYLILIPVLLTPFIYSGELYNGVISAKQIWFYAAMVLLFTTIGLHWLLTKRPLQIALNSVDLALLLFYCYLTIRAFTTPYLPILYNTRFINYSLCVVLYFIIKNWLANEEKGRKKTEGLNEASGSITHSSLYFFIEYFLILTGLGQAIWGLLQFYGILPSFNNNFKITGTFWNPAPYALYLAVIFPMALRTFFFSTDTDKIKKHLSFLTIITILHIFSATMIRAAWMGALTGSVVVLEYRYQLTYTAKHFFNTPTRKITAFVVTLIVFVLLGAGLYLLKKDSTNGKLFIWEVSLGKIAKKPLFGHGLGRFEAEYNNWQAEYFQNHPEEMDGTKGWVAGNTKYAFNDFLEMTSETGVIGLLMFLTLITILSYGAKDMFMTELDNIQLPHFQNLKLSNFQFPSFIVIIICMVISYPLFSLPTFILFFVLLSMGSAFISPLKLEIPPLVIRQWSKRLVVVGFLGTLVGLTDYTKSQYKGYYYWNEADKFYNLGFYQKACSSLEKVSKQMQYNGSFLRCHGKASYMEKQFTKSNIILKQSQNFISDVILYTTLGDNYKALKQYKQAEFAYQYASAMSPSKLYSLHLLAELYDETSQKEKATAIAKKIKAKKIKVHSKTIEEIRVEMQQIINK